MYYIKVKHIPMMGLFLKNITGAFALMDGLLRDETKFIFGYPGGAILPIYDELYSWEKQGLVKHILVRHEQGAIPVTKFVAPGPEVAKQTPTRPVERE